MLPCPHSIGGKSTISPSTAEQKSLSRRPCVSWVAVRTFIVGRLSPSCLVSDSTDRGKGDVLDVSGVGESELAGAPVPRGLYVMAREAPGLEVVGGGGTVWAVG